jgi:small-conductance mechanosensitive channel/CRP-like cAMP-binding protein
VSLPAPAARGDASRLPHGARGVWLRVSFAMPLLIASLILARLPPGTFPNMPPAALAKGLPTLAAFACAFAADAAIRRYLWYGRLGEDGRSRVPDIVIGLASAAGYALTGLVVAGLVLGLDVSAVVTTSGVVAIVLGVSAQQTLGQVFAGLALNLSRPFRIGDSLQAEGVWGRVTQADWRAVTLRTYDGTLVTLPNTLVAAARLTNLRTSTDILRHAIPFVVEPEVPPGRVRAVAMAAMEGLENVLRTPAPLVLFKNFDERGVLYEALFWHRDPNFYILRRDEVGQALWYAFRRAGLPVSVHRRQLARPDAASAFMPEAPTTNAARLTTLLCESRLWGNVPATELAVLAERARILDYAAGERIIREGDDKDGASMFLLLEGDVSVRLSGPSAEEHEIYTHKAGDVFGHMSALTGAPRFATVRAYGPVTLAEFDKASLAALIAAHPEVVESVAREILRLDDANRELRRMESMPEAAELETDPLRALRRVADRIRAFFQGYQPAGVE